jgi:hypothetical protein
MTDVISVSSAGSSASPAKPQGEAGSFFDRGSPLPESYGETRVVLLPRDPLWMFAYWEISDGTAREIRSRFGENIFLQAQPTIRMHEADLRDGAAKSIRFLDVAVVLDAKSWYLTTDKEGSSWFIELGLKAPNGELILIARSNLITLPHGRVSELTDERWVSIKEELEKILQASGGGKVGMGSLELARMLSQRWEMLSRISSWRGSGGVSSFGIPQAQPGIRKFWLVADCELVLYGATEPTATLMVAGKPIELFQDGTFSLRFALPDGKLDLPVKAVSGDRVEERQVKISVERKTVRD